MLGAIIGDIVGSRFEWNNIKTKDFDFFTPRCTVTDDSIMSLAVGQAILVCRGDYASLSEQAVRSMQEIGRVFISLNDKLNSITNSMDSEDATMKAIKSQLK